MAQKQGNQQRQQRQSTNQPQPLPPALAAAAAQVKRGLLMARDIQADVNAINAKHERQRLQRSATRRANALSSVIGDLQHAREHLMVYSELAGVSAELVEDTRYRVLVFETMIEELDDRWQGEIDAATGAHIPITPTRQRGLTSSTV